ncbi:ZIP zinc transporter domain-containing protein [Trichoderma breve]|uniref:ZIP zinc transporter domain-containing protein n=1 Tax=Trichoderma breve TaxID=2034170 RepID=A0A9W9B673_9HYPO|nr:ZIP zinc transporter domain-containing protein [Trichoderma breve]KAJ4855354.1 ZIP zinc transporter domain-containing protein [Trichoderma breve]
MGYFQPQDIRVFRTPNLCTFALLLAPLVSGLHPAQFVQRQAASTAAPSVTPAPSATAASNDFESVTACHAHGTEFFCMVGTTEYQVIASGTTSPAPEYTGCHHHGADTYCLDPNGEDVEVITDVEGGEDDGSSSGDDTTDPDGEHCHFHAGVEHCVGGDGENEGVKNCSRQERDYNIPLRIGLLFVILVTSFIGVSAPIFLASTLPKKFHIIFLILKQFGTGVIISTAFVHLFTHATLMFTNECLSIEYEGLTSAVVMAGLFLSWLADYVAHRISRTISTTETGSSRQNDEVVNVLVLEAGIIFHSLLIGLTLVVAGDSFFITLFIVIVFHQVFEGIALGTRIAAVELSSRKLSWLNMMYMALAFALVTPVGMAIGIGVLHKFNGNDPSTLIALGTLDALSAGILVWVGVVEMWARDWIYDGELTNSNPLVTGFAGFGLIAGMVLMSFLGKWA